MQKRMFGFPLSWVVLLPVMARSQVVPVRRPVPVNVYQDKSTGLSFQYPMVWKQVKEPGGIFGSSVFISPGTEASGVPMRAAVQYSAEGNSFANTTLESIGFLYGVLSQATAATCRKVITNVDASATHKVIHGVSYTYGQGGDAGMSQSLASQVYSTLQGSTCYVFEEDFNQTNGIVRDGQRELTKTERDSLQASLDNIIVTVRFPGLPVVP